MTNYFFDTYAFLEIIKGNPNYVKFVDSNFKTSILNLYELYYNLIRDYDEEKALLYFNKYLPFLIEIKNDYIFSASKFKLKMNKRNISYVDAFGYCISKIEGYTFLTGDKEFEGLDHVEFVK